MIVIVGVAATLGPAGLSIGDVYAAIAARFFPGHFNVSPLADSVVWNLRLPRIFMGLLAGFGLGVAGAVMQGVLRNPLASPFTLGISAAAGFGASLAIVLGVGIVAGKHLIIANAFVFSLLCTILMLALASRTSGNPATMILAGVALGFLFSAGTTLLQYFGDPYAVQAVVFWLIGDVGRTSWEKLSLVGITLLVTAPLLFWKSWDLNAMSSGDETARSLGVNVTTARISMMVITSLITATIVSFVGTIGFIGLVAPHIVRMAIGGDNRFVVPLSGMVGALLLAGADIVALQAMAPIVLPIGVITALMGVPLFLYFILRRKKEYL